MRKPKLNIVMLVVTSLFALNVAAEELLNDEVSFTVPSIGVPSVACVMVNGSLTCNPTPATNPVTATVSALLTEGNALKVAEGAPGTQAAGQNCGRLAKTVTVALGFGARVELEVLGSSPPIHQTIYGPSIPGTLSNNSIELCVNN